MVEIFANISDEVKRKAEIMWKIAISQSMPYAAADFLNEATEYYRNKWTDEEIDFLQFYFYTQMEMMKK